MSIKFISIICLLTLKPPAKNLHDPAETRTKSWLLIKLKVTVSACSHISHQRETPGLPGSTGTSESAPRGLCICIGIPLKRHRVGNPYI